MEQKLIDMLTPEQLPNEDLSYLVEIIGMDSVKKLLKLCGGMSFYVPRTMSRAFYMSYIRENYNPQSRNARVMARDLGITEQTVYDMLKSKMVKVA